MFCMNTIRTIGNVLRTILRMKIIFIPDTFTVFCSYQIINFLKTKFWFICIKMHFVCLICRLQYKLIMLLQYYIDIYCIFLLTINYRIHYGIGYFTYFMWIYKLLTVNYCNDMKFQFYKDFHARKKTILIYS
jgi:hypothetical protein